MALENVKLEELVHEVDQSKFDEAFSQLAEEDKKQVNIALAEEAKKERETTVAFRQERARLEEQANKVKDTATAGNEDFQKKFRDEQIQKASQVVFAKFGIDKPEDQEIIRKEFVHTDSGKLDAELIQQDFAKAVLLAKPDEFLSAWSKGKDLSSGAESFKSSMAGNVGGNGSSFFSGTDPIAKEVHNLVTNPTARKMGLTEQEAKDYTEKGLSREIR